MTIEMNFTNSSHVSYTSSRDDLRLTFWDNMMFRTPMGKMMEPETFTQKEVPAQMPRDGIFSTLDVISKTLKASAFSIFSGNFAINVLLVSSLSLLWGLLHSQ